MAVVSLPAVMLDVVHAVRALSAVDQLVFHYKNSGWIE